MWLELHDELEPLFLPRRLVLVFLDHAPPVLQWEAVNGEILFKSDDLCRANFEEQVMRTWMHLRRWYDRQFEEAEESIHGRRS